MDQLLRAESERIGPEVVRITRELIRIPSMSRAEGDVAARVEALLEELGYDLIFRDEAGNVVGVIVGGDEGPTVLLNSHMDTVAPGDAQRWRGSPFSGWLENGRIYGVGAADCKGGLAAQVYAGHLLVKSGLPKSGILVVAASVAEENGCSVGLRYLLDETLPRIDLWPDIAILGEPTELNLCTGHDGWVEIDAELAARDSVATCQAAELVFRDLKCSARRGGGNGEPAFMHVAEPEYVDGDEGFGATVKVTRRVLPGEVADDCVNDIRGRVVDALVDLPEVPVDVHTHSERQRLYTGKSVNVECGTEPWMLRSSDPIVAFAREVLTAEGGSDVRVQSWRLRRLGMGTGGSVLVNHYSIPAIGFGPGSEVMAHAPNESVEVSKLLGATRGTAILAHELTGTAGRGRQQAHRL